MNVYTSTIFVVMTVFVFSTLAYEWGNNIIDNSLAQISKENEKNDMKIIKNLINDVICSGKNSERTFNNEIKINPKKQTVSISNGTNCLLLNITTIDGISYDVYLERGTLYVFIYNISAPYQDVSYIKYLDSSICEFGGNLTINYSNNVRYYYTNHSKIYIYNLIMG
ncbi:hypothetical protein [Methanocaldococcus fervens]|uniref:Uncharacterized protein n=1 Tax=Methanocaldococcus fervens (strain DSM 4213 / JCM 15782 / AG86) TaxID=573064 RepID=C7P5V2_METFA|nr:hypothetical protein [Methanocaldococcus fervens]ACV23934.1 hypothetical protein Mefer_0092 [Methanocaldococcus fervens AG86]